ncbi:Isoleucyl-tRNA synthetase [Tribonema minus]|uniref:isoleucine--tRNA ligase n=1 Tax=Tribonema minus TaxID=303371 RepID=A0A835YNF4_9STRA|nr:Isoleucyl-tRNA synthetase [Tribonema minus]
MVSSEAPKQQGKQKQQQKQQQKQTPAEKQSKAKKPDSPYKTSVILPQTSFNQRANAVVREPELQQYWAENRVYEQLAESNPGDVYVLHDGPPYANGDLHIGHALNKILKDFINRYQLLQGKRARFVPGWDCHGLPIELKVLQSMKSGERAGLTTLQLRERAAAFATATVERQRDAFKRYGVWALWDEPYLTLQPEYEAAQIEVFGKMLDAGHIYRGRKPVNWSPSSRTALAEAELEYPPDHISTSMYAAFKVVQPSAALAVHAAAGADVRVAIWTTTPWTIPANLAVAVNEKLDYCLVTHAVLGDKQLVVAKELIPALSAKLGAPEGEQFEVVATLSGADLAGTTYQHPLYERQSQVVIGGDYITTETGTGLVHTAPGHGQEDYQTGLKYGLPLLSPVDDAGCFTEEAGERFQGLSVLKEGNEAVLEAMRESGALLLSEAYNHKYPYDWRTKKPTIFRATDQVSAAAAAARASCCRCAVQWIPEVGKNRITGMVQGRSDWCISRQRSWGVPIPVFYHKETGEPLLTQESIAHVVDIVREKGTDAWFRMSVAELLPLSHAADAEHWDKGTDTMDVWFDSGSSWAGVANGREGLRYPADMYLEGSDQHRGWFQSSLLTSVAANGHAPFKTVLTHGFVLDEKGFKMSKSLGNTVDPKEVIEGGANQKLKPAWGADVLRLWVSTVDYSGDVPVGDNILKQVGESYRKLRNTARYLTGNLFDFDPAADAIAYDDLPSLDKWVLGRLSDVMREVEEAYETYQFYRASQAIQRFAVQDLSNFYLDTAKDRLYISEPGAARRRSCQTVLHHVLINLSKAMAPILPHMAEDIWQTLPFPVAEKSIFQTGWVDASFPSHEAAVWDRLRLLRADVNKALEAARTAKLLGASLEAAVFIHCEDSELLATLTAMKGDADTITQHPVSTNGVDDLRFVLMVSQVELLASRDAVAAAAAAPELHTAAGESGCAVSVARAGGGRTKCDRCWYQCSTVGASHAHPGVCARCASVLAATGFVAPAPEVAAAAAAQ